MGSAARDISHAPSRDTNVRASPLRIVEPSAPAPKPSRSFWSGPGATVATLAASYVAARLIWGADLALVLCMVIVVHELGHFAVAFLGRFELTWPIIALPLGGVVFMDPSRAARPDRAETAAIVAGPLAGALAALAVAPMALFTDNPMATSFVAISALINGLNLLPVGILDGGHLARIVGLPRWTGWLVAVPALWIDLVLGIVLVVAALLGASADSRSYQGPARATAVGGWVLTAALLGALWITCVP